MPDFNQSAPPASVTNPEAATAPTGAPFPCHLYKFAKQASSRSLVVAWAGDEPIHNEFVVVEDEAGKADQLAKGFSVKPVLSAKKSAE